MIELRDVRFEYTRGGFFLRVPELRIAPGTRAAAIGPSGSGKDDLAQPDLGHRAPESRTRRDGRHACRQPLASRTALLSHHEHRLRVPGLPAPRLPRHLAEHPLPVSAPPRAPARRGRPSASETPRCRPRHRPAPEAPARRALSGRAPTRSPSRGPWSPPPSSSSQTSRPATWTPQPRSTPSISYSSSATPSP